MPDMMKSSASTAASVLTTLIERRSVLNRTRRFWVAGICCTARSGTNDRLPGKTKERGASSQPDCVGSVGTWTDELQSQPAPVEKAADRKMLKVARLLDACHVVVPRKDSVLYYSLSVSRR